MLIFVLHSTSDVGQTVQWTQTPSTTPLQPKKWNAHFLDYIELLMIGWDCQWTWTPSTTCLHPEKWNAHILIMFNFWWLARLVNGLKPHPPPLSSQKKLKCSFLDFVQLLMICWAGWWTQTPSTPLHQPKEWNAHFWIMFNFWWLVGLVDELTPHLPPLSSQ